MRGSGIIRWNQFLKTKQVIAILLLMLLLGDADAVPVVEWNRTFKNAGIYSVQQTTDGGYILAGQMYSYGAGLDNAYLIKTDASGDELWNKTYYGTDHDRAYSVQQTRDGGYIFTGKGLFKTDANGNLIWKNDFGAYSVQQIADGGYALAGISGVTDIDAWLLKTDANGSMQWVKKYTGASSQVAYSVNVTSDGGYILAGYTCSSDNCDAFLMRTHSNGDFWWSKTYGGKNGEVARSVQQTRDGGFIFTGGKSNNHDNYEAWLVKTDSVGELQWEKVFGRTGRFGAESVQQTLDDGYIILTDTYSYGPISNIAMLIKTDANGAEVWNMTFEGISVGSGLSARQTSDNGYILAAGSWLVKISNETSPIPETSNFTQMPANAIDTNVTSSGTNTIPGNASTKKTSGFEMVLPIAVLLAVCILVERRK